MAPDPRLPVAVLTGFLGSGKTTLLNRLLKRPELAETAVIVNEFGAIGIDHLLTEHASERPILLGNGCVCCALRDDLRRALEELRRRGAPFRRVVLETTGLAEPAPILQTLIHDPDVAKGYALAGIVATVDAVTGAGALARHEEARRQVAAADRLVITKTDLAGADAPALEARLRAINPGAAIVPASAREGVLFDDSARSDPERWFGTFAEPRHAGNGLQSFCLVRDRPVDGDGFALWLASLAAASGERLLRIKGFVATTASPDRPYLVQGVQHVLSPPVQLAAWPSDDRRTRLVFITDGLSRDLIAKTMEVWDDFTSR